MFKKFFGGMKTAGLWIYRMGTKGYEKYDALPEDQKDKIEDAVKDAVEDFFKKKKKK